MIKIQRRQELEELESLRITVCIDEITPWRDGFWPTKDEIFTVSGWEICTDPCTHRRLRNDLYLTWNIKEKIGSAYRISSSSLMMQLHTLASHGLVQEDSFSA